MDHLKCVHSLSTLRMLVMEDQDITFDQNEIEWEVEVEENLLDTQHVEIDLENEDTQQAPIPPPPQQQQQHPAHMFGYRRNEQQQPVAHAYQHLENEDEIDLKDEIDLENKDDLENENNQHVQEGDLEDEDMEEEGDLEDEDVEEQPGLFGSVAKASHVLLTLMNGLREEFGVEVAKKMIIETAKQANIPLHTPRDTTMAVDVDVNDMRARIARFNTATLQIIQRNQHSTVIDRCVEIVAQIKRLNSTTDYARVAVFAYLLEIAGLLEEVDASANHKELNTQLQTNLEIDKLTKYSKFKRKCVRVKKLCGVLCVPGGCSMAMYTFIQKF